MSPSTGTFANGEQVAEVTDISNSNQQDLFRVGSDGHLREDTFVDSTHTDSGQFVVDSNNSFPSNAEVTAYSDGRSINLFVVNTAGQMVWDQVINGALTTVEIFSTYGFTPGQAMVAQAQSGVLNLFGVATDGYLRQYQYIVTSGQWSAYGFSQELYMNPGTPLSLWYDGLSGLVDLYGELPSSDIGQWQYSPSSGWGYGQIDSSGASLPVPSGSSPGVPLAVSQANGLINIFAVNVNGNVGQVHWSASQGWASGFITAGNAGFAVGTALSVFIDSQGNTTIFGVGTGGTIGEVQYVGGGWNSYSSGTLSEPFATGSQVTFVAPSGEFEVLGAGANGHVLDYEWVYPAGWHEYDLG